MDQNIKKNHQPACKEKVASEAIKEAETPGQLASLIPRSSLFTLLLIWD